MASIALWFYAVPISKIDDGLKGNRLVTKGAYTLVRNPIYAAAMIDCTGVILIDGNAGCFILPLAFWLYMTVLMKATEEKRPKNLYGKEYEDYIVDAILHWGHAEEALFTLQEFEAEANRRGFATVHKANDLGLEGHFRFLRME